jgi:hypothetical protein
VAACCSSAESGENSSDRSSVTVLSRRYGVTTIGRNEIAISAQRLNIAVHSVQVRDTDNLEKSFQDTVMARVDALAITPNPLFVKNLKLIADFAIQNQLPSMSHIQNRFSLSRQLGAEVS